MVIGTVRRAIKSRLSLLIEWRSPRVWIEALEARRVLDATLIPADVPAGYFRYWGAGSNPADRDPELAVPFLEGQGTFKGTLATFWGDAPEVTRTFARLLLPDEREPGESSYIGYRDVDPRWQAVKVIDIDGPTFEIQGTMTLPESSGQAYCQIALINDLGGGSYLDSNTCFFYGDADVLGDSSATSRRELRIKTDDTSDLRITFADRKPRPGTQYTISLDWHDGERPQTYVATGYEVVDFGVEVYVPDVINRAITESVTATVSRLDGSATGRMEVFVVDERPQMPPSAPSTPTDNDVDPELDPVSPEHARLLASGFYESSETEFYYPATLSNIGYITYYYEQIPDDVTLFARLNNGAEVPVTSRLTEMEPLLPEDYCYELLIPAQSLAQGESRVALIARRAGQPDQVRELQSTLFTYDQNLSLGRSSTFERWTVREGETQTIALGTVYDSDDFDARSLEAFITLDTGEKFPVYIEPFVATRRNTGYQLTASIRAWMSGANREWPESICGTVWVRRGDQVVMFRTSGSIMPGAWITPTNFDLEWLNLPLPYEFSSTPSKIYSADGHVEIRLQMRSLVAGMSVPEISFNWCDDEVSAATVTANENGTYEVLATHEYTLDGVFCPVMPLFDCSNGQKGAAAPIRVYVGQTVGDTALLVIYKESRGFVANVDYGEIGYGVDAIDFQNVSEDLPDSAYSAEVSFDDGSPARAFVWAYPEGGLEVDIQPYFRKRGERMYTLTIRYADKVATIRGSARASTFSELNMDHDDWEFGDLYWGWHRWPADPLCPPTPSVIDVEPATTVEPATNVESIDLEVDPEMIADEVYWIPPSKPMLATGGISFGRSLIVDDSDETDIGSLMDWS